MSTYELGRIIKKANPQTIQNKFLVGYQGWFTCHGDGEPLDPNHHGWLHWFDQPIPYGGRPNTDLWPDVSEYSPSELYPAPGLTNKDGEQMFLFSSRHYQTVRRHFHWMALHGVDGAFLQRFAGQCDIEAGSGAIRKIRDEVGDRVREAAEAEGRVFAIMYDVSGVHPDNIQRVLEQDWIHLMREKCVIDSPNYLREKGKPVIALWGFGFHDRNHSPDVVRSITMFFRTSTPGGAYLIAGVPGHWRTLTSDCDPNPEFLRVWTEEFDALSPWTVGRYGNEEEAERWGNEKVKQDFDFLKQRRDEGKKQVDYMPVVLPGGSGYNLSQGEWGFNDIKRNGGHFFWKQICAARRAGVRIIYGAMWDEYDEGTAFMPVVSSSKQLPVHPQYDFLALDADGQSLPSDWYMRIAGIAAEILHDDRMCNETLPIKELQDYWAIRPRYEDHTIQEPKAGRVQISYGDWVDKGAGASIDDAPPPYSLQNQQYTPSRASNARPVPPIATKPTLKHLSGVSVSTSPPPPLPARIPTTTASMSSISRQAPAINVNSRPVPFITSAIYLPEKGEFAMRPQHFHQELCSSHAPAGQSSRVSSPISGHASSAVDQLADDLARQKVFQASSGVVSNTQQSSVSMNSSAMQPSSEVSPTSSASWIQYPGQHQQVHHDHARYNPGSYPPVPPSDYRSPVPTQSYSAVDESGYDRYDPNIQQHGPISFPRVEHNYQTNSQWPASNSGSPQGPHMTMNNSAYPYSAPYPANQDYHQHLSAQTQAGGSQIPQLYPPPEWGIQSSAPPTTSRPSYFASQSTPTWTGSDGGILSGLAGRATDMLRSRGRGSRARGRGRDH